jgi:hypothetical protein
MSQGALAAGRLAATMRPGRAAEGYAEAIAARLQRLAGTRRTGTLPFTGPSDGAIYFSEGRIVFAESSRTPGPDASAGSAGPGMAAAVGIAEPVADAALDLLDSQSSPARFRSAGAPPSRLAEGFSAASLLAEVSRRQHLLEQLAAIIRPDTTVVRHARLASERVQVSALQWSVLVRVRDGSTPRALAWELRRSVFGTTVDAYRLLALGVLAAVDYPVPHGSRTLREPPPRGAAAMSFTRAVLAQSGGPR